MASSIADTLPKTLSEKSSGGKKESLKSTPLNIPPNAFLNTFRDFFKYSQKFRSKTLLRGREKRELSELLRLQIFLNFLVKLFSLSVFTLSFACLFCLRLLCSDPSPCYCVSIVLSSRFPQLSISFLLNRSFSINFYILSFDTMCLC